MASQLPTKTSGSEPATGERSAQTEQVPVPSFRFMDLPEKIQKKILETLLILDYTVRVRLPDEGSKFEFYRPYSNDYFSYTAKSLPNAKVLRASSHIHALGRPILWGLNKFKITVIDTAPTHKFSLELERLVSKTNQVELSIGKQLHGPWPESCSKHGHWGKDFMLAAVRNLFRFLRVLSDAMQIRKERIKSLELNFHECEMERKRECGMYREQISEYLEAITSAIENEAFRLELGGHRLQVEGRLQLHGVPRGPEGYRIIKAFQPALNRAGNQRILDNKGHELEVFGQEAQSPGYVDRTGFRFEKLPTELQVRVLDWVFAGFSVYRRSHGDPPTARIPPSDSSTPGVYCSWEVQILLSCKLLYKLALPVLFSCTKFGYTCYDDRGVFVSDPAPFRWMNHLVWSSLGDGSGHTVSRREMIRYVSVEDQYDEIVDPHDWPENENEASLIMEFLEGMVKTNMKLKSLTVSFDATFCCSAKYIALIFDLLKHSGTLTSTNHMFPIVWDEDEEQPDEDGVEQGLPAAWTSLKLGYSPQALLKVEEMKITVCGYGFFGKQGSYGPLSTKELKAVVEAKLKSYCLPQDVLDQQRYDNGDVISRRIEAASCYEV